MGNVRRRLEALEGSIPHPEPPGRAEARARMMEFYERVKALRRGELSAEEAAEVEAVSADLKRRLAEHRGEEVR